MKKKLRSHLARLEDMKLEGSTTSPHYSFVDEKVVPSQGGMHDDLYAYFQNIRNEDDKKKTAAFATYRSDQKVFFERNGYGHLVDKKEYDVVMKKITQNHISNRANALNRSGSSSAGPPKRRGPVDPDKIVYTKVMKC